MGPKSDLNPWQYWYMRNLSMNLFFFWTGGDWIPTCIYIDIYQQPRFWGKTRQNPFVRLILENRTKTNTAAPAPRRGSGTSTSIKLVFLAQQLEHPCSHLGTMGTKGPITRSKGGVVLYGHLILLKVMKSLHQCKQKSATILNISPLQIVPHLLSRLMVLKTRNQKRLHTGNNGTHHTLDS